MKALGGILLVVGWLCVALALVSGLGVGIYSWCSESSIWSERVGWVCSVAQDDYWWICKSNRWICIGSDW